MQVSIHKLLLRMHKDQNKIYMHLEKLLFARIHKFANIYLKVPNKLNLSILNTH